MGEVGRIEAGDHVLSEVEEGEMPELVVFNKIDIAESPDMLMRRYEGSMSVSAVTGEGTELLLNAIADRLAILNTMVDVLVPFERGDIIAELHRSGQVMSEQATEHGMKYRARLDEFSVGRLGEFIIDNEGSQ